MIQWQEGGELLSAQWHSENGILPHKRILIGDDTLTADQAYRYACEGTAILYRGDFQNARQLLQALVRRVERPSKKSQRMEKKNAASPVVQNPIDIFNQYRLAQSQRARILGMILVHIQADHTIPLRRAPDVRQACQEVYGAQTQAYVVSLRELLGVISAHEWRKKGVPILLGEGREIRIHPHYGVFSPVRGEYIDLVLNAPLPEALQASSTAFDIGVGSGVLSALLASRQIERIVATDQDDRAMICAKENIERLNLANRISVEKAHLFPQGKAALIVCNPPWLPARPSSSLEHAVYDPGSQMLKGFLAGLKDHLLPGGEGWLVLSDLAEHLGLRSREQLLSWIEDADLKVIDRMEIKPRHPKASDLTNPLYVARSREMTSLWRLAPR